MRLTHLPPSARCWLAMCAVLWLIAPEAAAQVRTEVRLEKARYIAGEPVFVIVDVTNVGAWPLVYRDGWLIRDPKTLAISIENGKPDRPLSEVLRTCTRVVGINEAVGLTHPPLLMPGEERSFRFLFTGYTLAPGRHTLRVSGGAMLEWAEASYVAMVGGLISRDFGPPPPQAFERSTTVAGARVDRTLDLAIDAGSDEALRAAYAPYLADADGKDPARRLEARRTILMLAPAVVEESVARIAREYANQAYDQTLASDALGKLAVQRTPGTLRQGFLAPANGMEQARSLWALSVISTADDVPFLEGILSAPDVSSSLKETAALGLGHAGTPEAIAALRQALRSDPALARSIVQALGISRSRLAVPALIAAAENAAPQMLRLPEERGGLLIRGRIEMDLCDALATLTHVRWCEQSDRDRAVLRARWERWWAANGATAPIYGNDACVASETLRPLE
jgi:hypothetical protein